MKKNTTYNPQDIEELLLNKSFSELNPEEKNYVLTQVNDELEYKEMRNTLITVKQLASEEDSVYVPNRIKEDLMQLMEEKKKPLGWFNSIGAFLFPSNTPLFKKPGLQLVTVGLMLLLVVNIGIDFIGQPNKELAINTNQKTEETESLKNEIKEEEPVKVQEISENGTLENIDKKDFEEIPAAPKAEVIRDEKLYFDVSDANKEVVVENNVQFDVQAEDIQLEKPQVAITPPVIENKNADLDKLIAIEADEEVVVAKDVRGENSTVTLNSNSGNVNDVVALESVVVTSTKQKKSSVRLKSSIKSKSQNLNDNAEVIDLLFVAL